MDLARRYGVSVVVVVTAFAATAGDPRPLEGDALHVVVGPQSGTGS